MKDKQTEAKTLHQHLQQWIKDNMVARFFAKRLWKLYKQLRYFPYLLFCPVQDDVFLFESFSGRQYSDSPKAIYEKMIRDPAFRDCTFVWAFREPGRQIPENNRRLIQVQYESFAYLKFFAKAKYVFSNSRYPLHTIRRKKQCLVQTWHGTPFKRIGCDITLASCNYPFNTLKQVHELYTTEGRLMDLLISPSPYTTEKLTTAFNLKKFGKENIVLEVGYPRNDFLYQYKPEDVDRIRRTLHIPPGKKILLYAPTWRDHDHTVGVGYTYFPEINFELLREQLKDEYFLLFRPHQFIDKTLDLEQYSGFIRNVSDVDDVNDLYIISDMLITDYSSVFFDYANLRRPILFFMYDKDTYTDQTRGFYLKQDELPGPVCRNERELADWIHSLAEGSKTFDETYRHFNEKFTPLDDGNATERVIDALKKRQ